MIKTIDASTLSYNISHYSGTFAYDFLDVLSASEMYSLASNCSKIKFRINISCTLSFSLYTVTSGYITIYNSYVGMGYRTYQYARSKYVIPCSNHCDGVASDGYLLSSAASIEKISYNASHINSINISLNDNVVEADMDKYITTSTSYTDPIKITNSVCKLQSAVRSASDASCSIGICVALDSNLKDYITDISISNISGTVKIYEA